MICMLLLHTAAADDDDDDDDSGDCVWSFDRRWCLETC